MYFLASGRNDYLNIQVKSLNIRVLTIHVMYQEMQNIFNIMKLKDNILCKNMCPSKASRTFKELSKAYLN